jgi:outer membrane biosynthesis protein TonB
MTGKLALKAVAFSAKAVEYFIMRTIWLILGVCVIAGCSSQPDHAVWPEMTPSVVATASSAAPETAPPPPKPTVPAKPSPAIVAAPPTASPVMASGSPPTDYDSTVIGAIQHHWRELRGTSSTNSPTHEVGKVVIAFRVHSDGRVSNVKIVSSNVSGLLTYLCRRAVTDPAPYPRWPAEMIKQLGQENRVIQFTFSYD